MNMEDLMSNSTSGIKRIFEKAGYIHERIMKFFAILSAILVIGLVALLCYEVFMRYLIHKPPAWAWEVSESMVYSTAFLGAGWLLNKNGHVSVDIIFASLSPKIQAAMNAATSALGAVICLILTWSGIGITIDHSQAGITVPGYLDIPKAPLLLIIPASCFMLSIEFLRQAYRSLKRWKQILNEMIQR
jgi:TRAP-type C4-dicarboxylate transport system permease small subunit